MNKKITAEIIVDFLIEHQIKKVFDLSGGMIAFIEDAISKREGIDCFPMHHEQAAGFAAEGYARQSQNFGVAMATSGPGATNLMTAIGSCFFDSTPAMFIVGQVHTDNIKKHSGVRQEGFQETDIVSITKPITKYSVIVTKPEDVLYQLEKAYFIMKSGRQGAVLIDIPINLQRTEVEVDNLPHFLGSEEHKHILKEMEVGEGSDGVHNKVTQLESLLQKAKAPIVLVGNGVRLSQTTDVLADFVKRNNLPVIVSLLGLDSYPKDEFLVGFIGSNGNRDANIAFANADLIIALGTRLDIRQTGDPKFFNQTATVVHVDIDSNSLNYAIKSALTFSMDLQDFFLVTQKLETPRKEKWFTFIRAVQREYARPNIYDRNKVDANTYIHELSRVADSNVTVTVDVGQNQMWAAQSWQPKRGQRLLFSGGMGAMGFSLPASIGAWGASPESLPIVICGDGGLQINIQELETISRNSIPMKLFVFNNKSLGMVREFQDLYFKGNYQSTVIGYGCPDLKKLAYAYNFEYVRVDGVVKDDPTIPVILGNGKPTLIEVNLDIHATLQPKIVFGHALDDQAPYLSDEQKVRLEKLKEELKRD